MHQDRLGKVQFPLLASALAQPALEQVGRILQAHASAASLGDLLGYFLGQVVRAVVVAMLPEGFVEEVDVGVCGERLAD